MNNQTPKLNEALAKAQSEFEPISKNKTVMVRTKDGRSYSFDYADLTEIVHRTAKAMAANGLSWSGQTSVLERGTCLTVSLRHSSGESIDSSLLIQTNGGPQEVGSQLTYFRRYLFSSLLGVCADADDDANLASGNDIETKQQPKPAPKPTPQPKPSAPVPVIIAKTSTETANCRTCGAGMKLRKDSTGYYCPNYSNKASGEHTSFPAAKLNSYIEQQAMAAVEEPQF